MSVSASPVVVEGNLCKWTNYWNGWQPRWFVLEQGVLTYYKSREEVSQGCKGSVKVSACEIVPHPLDSKRLDIIIPSEQHYHLRAQSETDRQKWLVALGSVKQAAFSAETATAVPTTSVPELVNSNSVKKKKSELRLYCDLLMQQVHTIKTSDDLNEKAQSAELLNTTCDIFIRCLDECMKCTEVGQEDGEFKDVRATIPSFNSTQSAITGIVGGLEKQRKSLNHRPSSASSSQNGRDRNSRSETKNPRASLQMQDSDASDIQGDEVFLDLNGNNDASKDRISPEVPKNQDIHNNITPVSDPIQTDPVPTFFSLMQHSFTKLELHNHQIPVSEFLLCCEAILPVFDVLGSTAFAPVKMDIQGNINKLKKHQTEKQVQFLLELVQAELDGKFSPTLSSATDALLWLKRALAFICLFLNEACQDGEIDLALCATKAYGETLKKHHNFVVRGVFAVALRALPYYSTFIKALAPSPEVGNHPSYGCTLKRHGIEYTQHLQTIVTEIDTFYVRNDIVSPQNL